MVSSLRNVKRAYSGLGTPVRRDEAEEVRAQAQIIHGRGPRSTGEFRKGGPPQREVWSPGAATAGMTGNKGRSKALSSCGLADQEGRGQERTGSGEAGRQPSVWDHS